MYIFGLLAVLALSFASVAQAADIKASGKWQIEAHWNNDMDFANRGAGAETNSFHIEQRVRTAFQFIANENLKGVLDTQIGSAAWGNGAFQVGAGRSPNTTAATASAAGAGQGNIMLRQGYLDFKWPGTKVNFKVGYQTLNLPAAFGGGSAILDDQIAAAVVSAPINENVSILAGYARPQDNNTYGATAAVNTSGNAADAVFAAVPVSFKGFSIVPFAAFAYAGKNVGNAAAPGNPLTTGMLSSGWNGNDSIRAYFGGIAFTMTAFEPFKVMADFNYGRANYYNTGVASPTDGGRHGWLFDLAIDYTGLSNMTPELFFVYTSGEKGQDKNSSNRMPTIGNPQTWSVNNSFYFGDRNYISGFSTTSTGSGYAGYVRNVMGFWTLGASLKDIKLFDNFTHQVNLMYIKGTNDADYLKNTHATNNKAGASYGAFLTDKDHLWEIDLINKYKVYDELSLYLDLGYINGSFDKNAWRNVSAQYGQDSNLTSNAYHIGLGATYAF